MHRMATTADIISAIYLLVIIVGIYHISTDKSTNTKAYIYCCWVCLAGLVIDALSYLLQGGFCSDIILIIVTYIAYILYDFLTAGYCMYLVSLVHGKTGWYSDLVQQVILCLCAMDMFISTVGTITGDLFTVSEGITTDGPLSEIIGAIPGICLLVFIIYIINNRHRVGIRARIIVSSYFVLQGITAVIYYFDPTLISGYVGHSIALTIIFVMLQFRTISETTLQAEIFNALSIRDALTGLRNRRAFTDCLGDISPDANVRVAFCDINSLKEVNDTLGHAAGDRLIIRMAELLKNLFSDNEVFRISGDEFVVIMQDEAEPAADEKLDALRQTLIDHDSIAAFGYHSGNGGDIMDIMKTAEKKMYADKDKYYKENGKDRRA